MIKYAVNNLVIPTGDPGSLTVSLSLIGHFGVNPSGTYQFRLKVLQNSNSLEDNVPSADGINFKLFEVEVPSGSTDLSTMIGKDPGDFLPVSQAQSQPQDVLILGTLVVDESYYFANLSNIFFGSQNARLVIENGKTLEFLSSFAPQRPRISGCVTMWDEIAVESGGTLIMNYTTVTDGTNAIHAEDGSRVNVTNSTFSNNKTGIFTPEFPPTQNEIDLTIRNNVFEVEEFKPPLVGQQTLTAVQLNDVGLVVLENNSYLNTGIGILGNRSSVYYFREYFEGLTNGILVSGNGQVLRQTGRGKNENKPTFNNCLSAISASGMHVIAEESAVLGAEWGISIRNGFHRELNVADNIIRTKRHGIAVGRWRPFNPGFVRENNIYMDENDAEGVGIRAELVSGADGSFNLRENNIWLQDAKHGIYLDSDRGIRVLGNVVAMENANAYEGVALLNGYRITVSCNSFDGPSNFTADMGMKVSGSSECVAPCNCFDATDFGVYFTTIAAPSF
jgi:hypothetical protein